MNGLTFFYAVNKSGQGCLFTSRPERNEHRNIWVGSMNAAVTRFFDCLETVYGYALPDISWEDEPVGLRLSITRDE